MSKKIMVVDDNQFMRKRLTQLLSSNGYQVMEADDGVTAVEVYRQHKPDLTLMDVTMPRKDGLEALRDIRRLAPWAKVVMLTALDQHSVMVQAVQQGAKDFLTKPIPPEQLLTTVRKFVS